MKSLKTLFSLLFLVFSISLMANDSELKSKLDSVLNISYSQLNKDLYGNKQLLEGLIDQNKKSGEENKIAQLYLKLGTINHLLNKPELAVDAYNQSILLFEKNRNIQGAGNAYAEMGNSMRSRDLQKARKYMEKGVSLLEKETANGLEAAYDNYGVILHQQGKVDSALLFYNKSLMLKKSINDSVGIPYSLQKIAMINSTKGEFDQALEKLENALNISKDIGDSLLICETLTYYGDVYMDGKYYPQSVKNYEDALKIAKTKNYDYLVNYIYSELPDVYHELGEKDKAFEFLKEAKSLKDSTLNSERVRSIAELELFFESTQKEQKIKLLEQDLEINELKTVQNKRILLGLILFIVFVIAILSLLINRQKLKHKTALLVQNEKMQKDRLNSVIVGEEKERERVARELHDGLGQLLSAAKMHVSSLEDEVEEDLKPYLQNSIQLVDQACVEIREISHALLPKRLNNGELETTLLELQKMINAGDKIQFNLVNDVDLSSLKGQKAVAIYRIIQELVNNTIKHANASIIDLKVNKEGGKFNIHYADNGQNFKLEMLEKGTGIGWQNISSRIEMIGGSMDIKSINGSFNTFIDFE